MPQKREGKECLFDRERLFVDKDMSSGYNGTK